MPLYFVSAQYHLCGWNEKKKFLPRCPEFVVELRSPSDRLADSTLSTASKRNEVVAGLSCAWPVSR